MRSTFDEIILCLTNFHGRNGMVISSMFSMPKQRNRSFEFPMEKSFKILSFPAPSWSGLSGPSRNRSSGCKKVFDNAPRAFWIPAFAGMTGGQRELSGELSLDSRLRGNDGWTTRVVERTLSGFAPSRE
jgi:hypothetical protein